MPFKKSTFATTDVGLKPNTKFFQHLDNPGEIETPWETTPTEFTEFNFTKTPAPKKEAPKKNKTNQGSSLGGIHPKKRTNTHAESDLSQCELPGVQAHEMDLIRQKLDNKTKENDLLKK